MVYKAVILDFDGIILESCDIKTWAFGELFKEHPEYVDEIVEYHRKNGGVSRYKKFVYFYEELLKRPATDEEIEELGEKFSQLVFDEINRCDPVPGAFEFLEEYSEKLMIFVASGTPDEELRAIVENRGLDKYFKAVYGTPATKKEIIEKILAEESMEKSEVVFVGDSETDYQGAKDASVPFVYRATKSSTFIPNKAHCLAVVEDMRGLKDVLTR